MKPMLRTILLVATCVQLAGASPESEVKDAIEAAYEKASLAASLHFVDGMLSYRAPGYQVFRIDPLLGSRREIDLSLERERFRQLFDNALKVQLVSLVGKVTRDNETTAHCSVQHEFLIKRINTVSRRLFTVHFKSSSDDVWVFSRARGWRLSESLVREQSFFTEGQELKPVNSTPAKTNSGKPET